MIKKNRHNANAFRLVVAAVAVLSMLLLTGCVTAEQRYFADYQHAKHNFAIQNYHDAFVQLQGPARAGNPDAQYSLGYLYYYGKGVLINQKAAEYWFREAASQGHAKAKKALAAMHNRTS